MTKIKIKTTTMLLGHRRVKNTEMKPSTAEHNAGLQWRAKHFEQFQQDGETSSPTAAAASTITAALF
eukprot:CAMPEP_0198136118 /NCGR_PEP_ID=MMETSP1442-20131203/60944_1 /TAXON_ID= /ORGANISM="Craspedostauros australis, Strain CCMP3328" /LENGTH=66 /DNA_ID=CAMNT_0043797319 /DNA_START=95 /DNA_END=295 /DNA_ORIENTATION=+